MGLVEKFARNFGQLSSDFQIWVVHFQNWVLDLKKDNYKDKDMMFKDAPKCLHSWIEGEHD